MALLQRQPGLHAMAQAPQFPGSVCSFTHEPEHELWPSGQLEPLPPLAVPAAPASLVLPPWLMPPALIPPWLMPPAPAPACAALEPACALPALPAVDEPDEPALGAPLMPALPALTIWPSPPPDEPEQPASANQAHAMPRTERGCTLPT